MAVADVIFQVKGLVEKKEGKIRERKIVYLCTYIYTIYPTLHTFLQKYQLFLCMGQRFSLFGGNPLGIPMSYISYSSSVERRIVFAKNTDMFEKSPSPLSLDKKRKKKRERKGTRIFVIHKIGGRIFRQRNMCALRVSRVPLSLIYNIPLLLLLFVSPHTPRCRTHRACVL